MQRYVIILLTTFIMMVWYIRPLYNYMSIRKYVLLDKENLSMKRRMQSSLPALLFFILVLGLMFYPAVTNKLINATETGTIIALEIIVIFVLSRYDKLQTKYKVTDTSIKFYRREIKFDKPYKLKYKRSFWFVLHKPRFILKSENYTIVVPVLSKGITDFIEQVEKSNHDKGQLCRELYNNIRNYYISNLEVRKKINA